MKISNSPLVISLIGPPGSGKGTQGHLFRERFNFLRIETGDLLRQRAKQNDFTGRKINHYVNEGLRISSPIVTRIWIEKMEKIKDEKGDHFPGLIIDGSPRTMLEAQLLEEGLYWYEWNNFKVVFINIDFEESKRRLLEKYGGRGRADDNLEDLKERWAWYQKEVLPTVKYFRSRHNLIEVNGEQEIESLFETIINKLGIDDYNKK